MPNTPQFTAALANDVQDHLRETRGIFSNTLLQCTWSSFTQFNDPYSDFTFSQRTKQIGIKALRLNFAQENTFTLLHTGIELSNVLQPSSARPINPSIILLNQFIACRRGVEVHGRGLANRGGGAPPPAQVSLPLTCNTFDRGNSTRPGTAYGVYLDADAFVTFDPLPVVNPAPTLANKFFDYNVGSAGFYALYNGSPVAFAVKYTTYSNYIQRGFGSLGVLPGHSDLRDLCTGVGLIGAGVYQSGQACGTGNPGLERTSKFQSGMKTSSPNPASGFTTLHYQVATNATKAEMQVRRSTDGKLVHQKALRPGSTALQLSLQDWQPGVYVVTLYVDALPTKSTKLIVQ